MIINSNFIINRLSSSTSAASAQTLQVEVKASGSLCLGYHDLLTSFLHSEILFSLALVVVLLVLWFQLSCAQLLLYSDTLQLSSKCHLPALSYLMPLLVSVAPWFELPPWFLLYLIHCESNTGCAMLRASLHLIPLLAPARISAHGHLLFA